MIGKYPKCYNRYIIHYKIENVINKHKSNKIKENSNTVRHLNNGTDHRHSKSCCDQSSSARRTIMTLKIVLCYVRILHIDVLITREVCVYWEISVDFINAIFYLVLLICIFRSYDNAIR